MSYLVLPLKWRPQRFSEVVGQGPVSRTLSNALRTGRAAQAYLFSGPRGVGKTTMARILAKALNCERAPADEPCNECGPCREITAGRAMDVIEIDGASNRGIDDIRELRESAQYTPAFLTRKVYIIDEVHMLTTDAFNALLKTLEEPPRHVVFVLATTEPLKVPATILSRCQRFDFARLSAATAFGRLRQICDAERIGAQDDALHLVARKGDGSMRDALTLLDQVVATGQLPLTADGVREALGITGYELFFGWTAAIQGRDVAAALRSLAVAVEGGASLQEMAEEFVHHLRNLLVVATDPSLTELVEVTQEERGLYLKQAEGFAAADLLRFCRMALETVGAMRRSAYPLVHLEVALAEMCALPTALDLKRFIEVTRGRFPDSDGPAGAGGAAGGASATGNRGATATGGSATARVRTSGASPPRGAADDPPPSASASSGAPYGAGLSSAGSTAPGSGAAGAASFGSPGPGSSVVALSVAPSDDSTSVGPEPVDSVPAIAGDPWPALLASVQAQKPALATCLAGSAIRKLDERILEVGVPGLDEFRLGQLERPANRQYLLGLAEKFFGRAVGLRFAAAASSPGQLAASIGGSVPGSPGTTMAAASSAPGGASSGPQSGAQSGAPFDVNAATSPGSPSPPPDPNGRRGPRVASPERIQKIADLFGGDVIGPA